MLIFLNLHINKTAIKLEEADLYFIPYQKSVIYVADKPSVINNEKEYIIKEIQTDDEEMDSFLFTLGCYSGEPITVISCLKGGCVVSIKDGRYNIDNQLAAAIII